MCVISISDRKRVTSDAVEKMYQANSAGGGIAWRETDEDGKVWVRYEKGLDLKQMLEMCETVPLPFVAHFRIPTVGGAVPELCHPFVINKDDTNELSGRTTDYVLFHNGHWAQWKATSMDLATKSGVKIQTGKWSDTRAMAWVAAVCGPGVLDFIDERTIIFGPRDTELTGTGWSRVDDIVVSNASWNYSTTNYGHRAWQQRQQEKVTVEQEAETAKRVADAKAADDADDAKAKHEKGKAGGTSLPMPFRPPQAALGSGGDQQEQVQEGEAEAGTVAEEAGKGRPAGSTGSLIPDAKRWACSINPRRYSSHPQGTTPLLIRDAKDVFDIEDDEEGKIRTGMLGPGF